MRGVLLAPSARINNDVKAVSLMAASNVIPTPYRMMHYPAAILTIAALIPIHTLTCNRVNFESQLSPIQSVPLTGSSALLISAVLREVIFKAERQMIASNRTRNFVMIQAPNTVFGHRPHQR